MQLPVENGPGRMKPRTVRGRTEGAGGTLAEGGWDGRAGEDGADLVADGVSGERPPRH